MKSTLKNIWIVLLVGLTIVSCNKKTNTSNTNYALLYSQVGEVFQPKYIIYHASKDSTFLHFQLRSNEILYVRKDKSQPFHAKIVIHYELFNESDRKTIIDSATKVIEDVSKNKAPKNMYGEVGLKLAFGQNYKMFITATDEHRNTINEYYVAINKSNQSNEQFFMMIDDSTKKPLFDRFSNQKMACTLKSEANAGKTLFANFYQRNFPTAAPPFASKRSKPFDYDADSSFVTALDENGLAMVSILDSGFVHFLVDSSQREGFTYYTYSNNYPKIKDVKGMIAPLRYVSSKTEFENMQNDSISRQKMESFWITKCGSKERAREIIKQYYNRVQNANSSFSSYVEGWKTDRGMVSLIYGLPKTVRKSNKSETWYYGDETNIMALQFSFVKVDNPFSDNDFKLQRAIGYKSSWYRAVDAWRSGRIYWAQ